MKFSEVVKVYSAYRQMKEGSGKLDSKQIEGLARMVKNGQITEKTILKLKSALHHFSENKPTNAKRHGVPTLAERARMKKARQARLGNKTASRPNNKFAEDNSLSIRVKPLYEKALLNKRDLNEKKNGSRFVSAEEKAEIRKNIVRMVERRNAKVGSRIGSKVAPNGKRALSEKEVNRAFYGIRSKIREAHRALREDDMNMATNAVQDASAQLDGIPVDGANVPENIKAGVQNLKTQIDDLAVQCGIQPATDVGADPNAQIPAVTGADPSAGADAGVANAVHQQTFESHKTIAARITERNAMLKKMKEGVGDTPDKMTPGEMGAGVVNTFGAGVSKSNPETQLKTAPLGTMTNGSEKKSIKWPNKAISNPKEPKNIAESAYLTEKDIDEFLTKKSFNFSDLYAMSNGLLG